MFSHLLLSQGSFQSFHSLGFNKFLLDIGEAYSGFAAGPEAQGVALLPPKKHVKGLLPLYTLLQGSPPDASGFITTDH